MNERQIARWEQMRKLGRRHFVRRYGVVGWGVTSGLLFAAWMLINSGDFDRHIVIAVALFFSLPCFMLGGVFMGHLLWLVMEWQYNRARDKAG